MRTFVVRGSAFVVRIRRCLPDPPILGNNLAMSLTLEWAVLGIAPFWVATFVERAIIILLPTLSHTAREIVVGLVILTYAHADRMRHAPAR